MTPPETRHLLRARGGSKVLNSMVEKPPTTALREPDPSNASLVEAAYYGYAARVDELLANGRVEIDERDEDGCTPLHLATVGRRCTTPLRAAVLRQ
jgi:ankyrin repeat protein